MRSLSCRRRRRRRRFHWCFVVDSGCVMFSHNHRLLLPLMRRGAGCHYRRVCVVVVTERLSDSR